MPKIESIKNLATISKAYLTNKMPTFIMPENQKYLLKTVAKQNSSSSASYNSLLYNSLLQSRLLNPKINSKIYSYKTELAADFGTTIDKLTSVLAPDELINILKKAKAQNFSTGDNFENVLNGTFNINLHMHSHHSDGKLSPMDILNQAVEYANYRKKLGKHDPVIVGLSDHDNLKGSIEAIRIIANNPEKYKNIRFVSAIERNGTYENKQFEAICYGINPLNKIFKATIENNATINKTYLEDFLTNQVNKWEEAAGLKGEQITTFKNLTNFAKSNNIECAAHLKYCGSGGLMKGFANALKALFDQRGWRHDGIDKFINQHISTYHSLSINPSTPSLAKIIQTTKESNCGLVGIAHPCRNFRDIDLRPLFKTFKTMGVDLAEANYQYNNEKIFSKSFIQHAELATEEANMTKAGGQDNHTDNIFTNISDLDGLPTQVKNILSHKQILEAA